LEAKGDIKVNDIERAVVPRFLFLKGLDSLVSSQIKELVVRSKPIESC